MSYRTRFAFLLLVLLSAVLVAACSASTPVTKTGAPGPASGTPSDALLKLDAQGRGQLSGVDLEPGGAFIAFEPEQRAIERQWIMANVGVHDHARGVRTVLTVPMWYDARTRFVENPWMKGVHTLSEATKRKDFAWSAAGTCDVKFHLVDDVFYIDEVNMPADKESDPKR